MATIPNWLNQPDFLGAIRSGAGLGLDRGRLNLGYANLAQNQDEAVNRLQFAYDQLASQQEESQANREERATLASDALKERALESSLRLMELASRNAAAAGYHKEALEARKASDALRYKIEQQNADTRLDALMLKTMEGDKEFKKVDLSPGDYMTPGGGHFTVRDPNKLAIPQENALRSRIASDSAILAKPDASPEQKAFAADDLKRAQKTLGIELVPEVSTPTKTRFGIDWLAKDVPVTNMVVRPSSALVGPPAPPPPTGNRGIRVRQKSTGRLATWTGPGDPPEGFEIIEEPTQDER